MASPGVLVRPAAARRRAALPDVPARHPGRADLLAHVRERPRRRSSTASPAEATIHAFQITAVVAFWAVLANTVFGVITALLLVRHDFRGKRVLNALIDLPLAVSPVIVGLSLILVYGRTTGVGQALAGHRHQHHLLDPRHGDGHDLRLASRWSCAPSPRCSRRSATTRSRRPRPSGAGPVQTFLRITLPSIRGALAYGVVLALARSLGEYGAVAVVSGRLVGRTQTVTLLVQERYLNFDQETAYACALLLVVTAVVALIVSRCCAPKEITTDEHHRPRRRPRASATSPRSTDVSVEIPTGSPHRAARAERRRQVDAAAGDRRPGDARHRAASRSRAATPPRLPAQDRGVGFVFQHYAAFKHLTVRAQRRLRPGDPQAAQGRDQAAGRRAARARPPRAVRPPLPGAALGRPAAADGAGPRARRRAAVLLLDEPFGALDAQVRKELRAWLRRLHDQVHVTTVFVTHDQEEAMEVADSIVVMAGGEVEQVGTPDELYDEPGQRLRHELPRAGHQAATASWCARTTSSSSTEPRPETVAATVDRVTRLGFEVRVDLQGRRRRALGAGHPRHAPSSSAWSRARPCTYAGRRRCGPRPRPSRPASR